jgi:hypothetical protein
MPEPGVQRNASEPERETVDPATTAASADTATASLSTLPDKLPSRTIPELGVQRKASTPEAVVLHPTTTKPLPETPSATLL